MKRKDFIGNSVLGVSGLMVTGLDLFSKIDQRTAEDERKLEGYGFNHLPHTNSNIMSNKVFHAADSRGNANHGWLQSRHTFSFANYYNPDRIHFGALRVLNDDTVAPGMGFGTHPHDNMEIISIPLEGDLQHKDSMGNVAVIKSGDIQVMSAGTGIRHSEYNKNRDIPVKFLQIWIFPDKKDVTPRYDQITLNPADIKNRLQQVVSPDREDEGVWIHQKAWIHLGDFNRGTTTTYTLHGKDNGVYIFNLEGTLTVDDISMNSRDGLGIWDTEKIEIHAESDARLLVMEVPMKI
ncbi:MAG: pirin family protein [Saprospiraceae bacterium]|nr:pirin family protein [Saprospiraceae bacterium]